MVYKDSLLSSLNHLRYKYFILWLKKGGAFGLFSITFSIIVKGKITKKMERQKPTVAETKKLALTPIKKSPFSYATNGETSYITCGKMILETKKNLEEVNEWIKEKDWELIALLCEAFINEIINNKEN